MASPSGHPSASPIIMDDIDILDDLNFDSHYSMGLADTDPTTNAKIFSSDIRSLSQNHRGMSPPDSDPESSTESTSPPNSGAGNRQSPSATPPQKAFDADHMTIDSLEDSPLAWNNTTYMFGQQSSSKMPDTNMMGDDMFDFSAFESSTGSNPNAAIGASHTAMFQSQQTSQKRSRSQEASLAMASAATGNGFYNGPNVMGNSIASMQWLPEQNMGFRVPSAQFPMGLLPMGGMGINSLSSPHQQLPLQQQQQLPLQQQQQQQPSPQPSLPGTSNFPYNLMIHPAPSKSRVETQLNIVVSMDNLPEQVAKLHLPTHCISKPKLMAKPPHKPNSESLELYCMVVCSSVVRNIDILRKVLMRAANSGHPETRDPNTAYAENDDNHPKNGGEVHICSGCIQRERKRAARKKIKNIEEDELWSINESRRIVVFNTFETIEWTKMEEAEYQGRWQAIVPMRIACYCRHHGEKEGFRVIMTIKDHVGNVMAQTMTENIMITDDHKTHPVEVSDPTKNALYNAARARQPRPRQITSHRKSVIGSSGIVKNRSRRDSDGSPDSKPCLAKDPEEPSTKRRKSSGGSPSMPMGMVMTPIDTPQSQNIIPPTAQLPLITSMPTNVSTGPMAAPSMAAHQSSVSPFTPNVPLPFRSDGLTSPVQGLSMHGLSVQSPINDQTLFSPDSQVTALGPLSMMQFNSTPSSAGQSRDPSPGLMQTPQPPISTAHGMMGISPVTPQNSPAPFIQKVVPGEGSKCGGSEVTVLGVHFRRGMRVMFGDRESTTTNYWGENTLLCRAPPSSCAGIVRVTVAPEPGSRIAMPHSQATFKYLDDDGEQLIRMALTILNHKMNGKMEDADSVARRVFNSAGSGLENPDHGSSRHSGHGGGVSYNRAALNDVEGMVMKCLENIDLCTTMHVPQFDSTSSSGQTMLHLAASQGYNRVVAGLLARGANPNMRDSSGYTALHLAALNNNVDIVRRLIINRADVSIKSIAGYRATDMATSDEVTEILSPYSQLRRSLSNQNLLLSRPSSIESLESLPRMVMVSRSTNQAGQISPEYSSFEDDEFDGSSLDLEEEEEDSDAQVDVNNSSIILRRSTKDVPRSSTPVQDPIEDDEAPPVSPGVAANLAAHLQQIQQTMTEHLPSAMQLRNFSSLTGIPTLANFPAVPQMGLPENQAFRRFVQMFYGTRAAGADDQVTDGQATTARSGPEAPPAYDDIFPGSDTKGARSADEAAARLEALRDAKEAAARVEEENNEQSRNVTNGRDETDETDETDKTEDNYNEINGDNESTVGFELHPEDLDVLTIGPKNAITMEQQKSFLRVYHAKNTGLGADRNLWLVWIPLLLLMIFAMFATTYPHIVGAMWVNALDYFGVPEDSIARELGFGGLPVGNMLTLTKLSDVLGTAVAAATASQATAEAVAKPVAAIVV